MKCATFMTVSCKTLRFHPPYPLVRDMDGVAKCGVRFCCVFGPSGFVHGSEGFWTDLVWFLFLRPFC